jgi:hypothetical protein
LNKNSSPTTSACEDFLIDVSTPKMLLFFLINSLKPTTNPSMVATYVYWDLIYFLKSKEGLSHLHCILIGEKKLLVIKRIISLELYKLGNEITFIT